ncbi:MAG: phosphoenolpyruvate carboxykinase (GTP) [Spirochaetales bacterium]|nr:MAG: phosphoenolpyruvate carboxykinase (GTP) [Spirochaetales bacterium]
MKLELKKGVDILSGLGGIKSMADAEKLFALKLDKSNLEKLSRIKNEEALFKIANSIAMLQPDSVWINSASASDIGYVREMAVRNNEEFNLKLKDHTCHFDLPEDQGRMVDQTFYIVNEGEDVSVLAKKMMRGEAHDYMKNVMSGMMKGKTLLVSFWNRGPVGAKAAIPAIMITDSFYVVHSGNILYPAVYANFDEEVKRAGLFFFNTHAAGNFKSEEIPKARIFMDRSWFTTYSMYCTYAGNTLLLKKGNHRFAVDLCTYYREEDQLSEHMFITGLTGPGGRKTFFAGAAPSGCGKTTTAMVGTDFIGDDLAQIWIEKDGTIRAVNPETGVFGIVQDVNQEGDPLLMKCLRGEKPTEVIWSNVLIDDNGVPHWTGHGETMPDHGKNYLGAWTPDKKDTAGKPVAPSNANARITLSCSAIDNYNQKMGADSAGCPISVITYSGRDSDTMPPVWVAKTPDGGVVIGASILSAATATEVGAKGVNRQPWANAPFTPGPLADYMAAQFKFFNSSKIKRKPVMAGLNYFLTHGARGGEPGDKKLLGEKRDVKAWLTWLEYRAHGEVEAIDTPIGFIPKYEDLKKIFKETIDKDYGRELYDKQFSFYMDNIIGRIELQKEAYSREKDCPKRIFEVYEQQKKGLEALKARYGSIVKPDQLSAGV